MIGAGGSRGLGPGGYAQVQRLRRQRRGCRLDSADGEGGVGDGGLLPANIPATDYCLSLSSHSHPHGIDFNLRVENL